jgi:hypothetical protein
MGVSQNQLGVSQSQLTGICYGYGNRQAVRYSSQKRKAKTLADFRSLALAWYEHKKPGWSDKHSKRVQWLLEKHLFPSPIEDMTAPELVSSRYP